MEKEYLVEAELRKLYWVEAYNEKEAKERVLDLIDDEGADSLSVKIIDERELENDDDYLEYLDDDEEAECDEEW